MKIEPETDASFDPELEAMLNEALRPAAADEALVGRILAATSPRLGAPPLHVQPRAGVLAQLRPALMALAATLAIASGLTLLTMHDATVTPPGLPPATNGHAAALAQFEQRLDALAAADRPWMADIDRQISLLSLQVDVTSSEGLWSTPDRAVEDAVLRYQIDSLLNDPMMMVF